MKRSHNSYEEISDLQNKVVLVERNDSPGGVVLVNPKKSSKKTSQDLVELAMDLEKADSFIHANACNKLQVIAQQMRFLQKQAKHVLEEARFNASLHHAASNFVKVPGNTYHLYKRPSSGQQYFSMLSPQEWTSPHEFIGSYRLENDQSWTREQDLNEKDAELSLIKQILPIQNPCFLKSALQETAMET